MIPKHFHPHQYRTSFFSTRVNTTLAVVAILYVSACVLVLTKITEAELSLLDDSFYPSVRLKTTGKVLGDSTVGKAANNFTLQLQIETVEPALELVSWQGGLVALGSGTGKGGQVLVYVNSQVVLNGNAVINDGMVHTVSIVKQESKLLLFVDGLLDTVSEVPQAYAEFDVTDIRPARPGTQFTLIPRALGAGDLE